MSFMINPFVMFPAGGGAFSPADLTLIAWYDPSDLSTLWQDTAGTTAVTTDGQSVARIDDKSGNGYHMLQGAAAKRPLYKTSGGLHWLEFDGTDDGMDVVSQGNNAVTMPQYWTACAGVRADTTDLFTVLDADKSNSPNNRYAQFLRTAAASNTITFNTGETAYIDGSGETMSAATDYVMTANRRTSNIESYIDQVSNGSTATAGTAKSGASPMSLGKRVDTDSSFQYMDGRIYGCVLTDGDLNSTDQNNLEQWMADKSGVTL